MMHRHRWRTAILVAAAAGLLYWTMTPLKPFQDCIQQRQNDQAYQALREKEFSIVQARVRTRLYLACAVHAADAYQNFIEALSGVVVAFFTGTLWWITRRSVKAAEIAAEAARDTVAAMREIDQRQTDSTTASIDQASRAATAMEGVSMAMAQNVVTTTNMAEDQREFWQRQMRAYLSTDHMGIAAQNPDAPRAMEVRFILKNTGHTPAYNVVLNTIAKVLPFPLPDDFDFILPDIPRTSTGFAAPNQSFTFGVFAERVFTERQIDGIKTGATERLFAYGIITYKDAFGNARWLKFCQWVAWMENGDTRGFNTWQHNDAN